MSKYQAILFDFDGTLIDTNQFIFNSWQYMAEKIRPGFRFEDSYMTATFGIPLWDAMVNAQNDFGFTNVSVDQMCDYYREYQRNNRNLLGKPFPGIKELVFKLKEEGHKIGIVTSRRTPDTKNGLAENGMDVFDVIVGADDTDIHKPDPEPAFLCCRQLGVDPSKILMVGDSSFDMECGKNAGGDTVFVSWSACTKPEDLTGNAKPDYIIQTAEELFKIINE